MKSFIALAFMLFSLLLYGTLVQVTSKDLRMTAELLAAEQAYYLVEAGLARAEQQITLDPMWRGEWNRVPLGAGSYSVRVYEQAGSVWFEAVGEVGKVTLKKTKSRKM